MENIVTQTRTKEASVTHRIQEMEEPQALMIQKIRLHQTKKMLKKKPADIKHPGNLDTMKRQNLRLIGIEWGENPDQSPRKMSSTKSQKKMSQI